MVSGTLALKNGYYYAVLSYQDAAGKRHQCKCQYKNVQKVENINVQFTVSGFSLLSFQDRTFVLQTIRRSFD